MAYAQDTIISANAANVFCLALDTLLMDAGWTVVETLNPAGTNTPINRVYKSSGASNECGYDWYLAVMWKTTGTESFVQIIPGGAYDIATHVLTQIPYGFSHSTSNTWADGVNVNVATSTTVSVTPLGTSRGTSQDRPWWCTIVPSSAFGYWMSVTLDHVAAFTTIATINGPPNFFASTLDVDPEWTALDTDFGNGVALNPIVTLFGTGTNVNGTTSKAGVSVGIIGSANTTRLSNNQRLADNVGVTLPILDGPYLPAFAWRSAYYLASAAGAIGSDPSFDSPIFGDGYHIGDGIDYYQVRGGAIGDTVEIDGGTYVLSGPYSASGAPSQVTLAVLVE